MSAKEELRDMISALTPEEINTILERLPQINASLLERGLPQIGTVPTAEEKGHTEAPAATEILADRRRPA